MNLHDSEGQTALHKACLHGHAKLAQELVYHGAMTDAQTSAKLFTPLHLSCIYNRHEVGGVWLCACIILYASHIQCQFGVLLNYMVWGVATVPFGQRLE